MLEENFQNKIQRGYKISCSCCYFSNNTKNEGLHLWSDGTSPSTYGISFLCFYSVEILCMADLWVWLLLSAGDSVCVNAVQANFHD